MTARVLRQVVFGVVAFGVLSLGLIGVLAFLERDIPDILVATASGSLTGLVGLLVPRPQDEP